MAIPRKMRPRSSPNAGRGAPPKPKIKFETGDNGQVTDGPFANFTGVVDEVRPDRGRVRVMISVFGRPSPVELEFTQLEKI